MIKSWLNQDLPSLITCLATPLIAQYGSLEAFVSGTISKALSPDPIAIDRLVCRQNNVISFTSHYDKRLHLVSVHVISVGSYHGHGVLVERELDRTVQEASVYQTKSVPLVLLNWEHSPGRFDRLVIAIKTKTQLPNTLPSISELSNWHYQLK